MLFQLLHHDSIRSMRRAVRRATASFANASVSLHPQALLPALLENGVFFRPTTMGKASKIRSRV